MLAGAGEAAATMAQIMSILFSMLAGDKGGDNKVLLLLSGKLDEWRALEKNRANATSVDAIIQA